MGNINLYKSSSASGPWSLVKENIQSPVTFDEAESGLTYYAVRDEGNGSDITASDYKVISEPVYVFGSTDNVSNITFDDSTEVDSLIIKVTSACGDASNHKVQVQINVKDTGWRDLTQVEIGSDIQATYTLTEEDGATEGSQIKFRAYIFNTANTNYRTNYSEEYVYTLGDIEDLTIYIDIPIPSSASLTKKGFAVRKELGKYSSNIVKFSYKASLNGDDIFSAANLDNLYLPCLTSNFTPNAFANGIVYNETFNGAKMLVACIKIMGVYVNKQINIKYIDINTQTEINGDVNFICITCDINSGDSRNILLNATSIPSSNSYYVIIFNAGGITVNMAEGASVSLDIKKMGKNGRYSFFNFQQYSIDAPKKATFANILDFNNAAVSNSASTSISQQIEFNSAGGYSSQQMIIISSTLLKTGSYIQALCLNGGY